MIHHINTLAWIEPTSRTTSRPRSGGSRRRPALPLGKSPLPFQRKTTFWSRLIAASASSTSPRAWPGLHVGRYPRPRGLCASLFVFIAVKSVVPDVAGVVSLRRGRHRAGHSLRPYLDFRLFAFRQVLHGRALPRPHAMLSGERRWPSRRWVLSTPMHSAPSRCRCSGGRCIEAVDGIPGRRKQSQESRARLRARASFQSFSSGLHRRRKSLTF